MKAAKLHIVPKPEEEHDWWDDLSDAAKASIEQGLKDAKEGKVMPHEEVMKKYKKYL